MSEPRKPAIGKHISSLVQRRSTDRELREYLADNFNGGRPIWGEGVFVRHIVIDLFTSVSYCGRFCGSTSTSPMPTPIGRACQTCVRRWNALMDEWNEGIEARNAKAVETYRVKFAAFVADDEYEEFYEEWKRDIASNDELRPRLIAALAECGKVDVAAALAEGRERLGLPEPFSVRHQKKAA